MRMQIMPIGNSFFLILLVLLMSSCRFFEIDERGDYEFISYIINGTDDSLRVHFYNEISMIEVDTIILPNNKIFYNGAPGVAKEDNILTEHLFSDYYNDSYIVDVYRHDSLLVQWSGTAIYMENSIHHFYNYDSWSVKLIDNVYELEFTIFESDLKGVSKCQ